MKKLKIFIIMLLFVQISILGTRQVSAAANIIKAISNAENVPVVAVEIFGSRDEIVQNLSAVKATAFDSNHEKLLFPYKWDLSSVNMESVGVYKICGSVQLPEGYVLQESVTLPVLETVVSVQRKGIPEIDAYYRISTAGVYVFPWVTYEAAESMNVWLKKAGGEWENLTEKGLAKCGKTGLQLLERALIKGNTYSLAVTYNHTISNTLKFICGADLELNIISYQKEFVGSVTNPADCISSYNEFETSFFERYYAEALPLGTDLETFLQKIEQKVSLSASTSETFENTEENPAIVLNAQWDVSTVNVNLPGVYKITGTFQIPDGYTLREGLEMPTASVYVSVQKPGDPQINTYYMPDSVTVCFPVLYQGMTKEQLTDLKIYFRKQGEEYKVLSGDGVTIKKDGIYLGISKYLQENCPYEMYMEYLGETSGVYSFVYKDQELQNERWVELGFASESGEDENTDMDPGNEEDSESGEDEIPEDGQEGDGSGDDTEGDLSGEAGEDEDDESDGAYYSGYSGSGSYSYSSSDNDDSSFDSSYTSTASSVDSAVKEENTETTTVISGQQMNLMMEESGDMVSFKKDGITVFLSESTLKGWAIKENEGFKIIVQRISDAGFSIRVFVRNEEVTEIPGTKVEISASGFDGITEPESVQVQDTDGEICESTYYEEKGILEIFLEKTGDYFMEDAVSGSEDTSSDDEYLSDEEIWGEEDFSDEELGDGEEGFSEEEIWGDEEILMEEDGWNDEGIQIEGDISDEGFTENEEASEKTVKEKVLSFISAAIGKIQEKETLMPIIVVVTSILVLFMVIGLIKRKK